jgi:AhpD family alkylhydroperoxidase
MKKIKAETFSKEREKQNQVVMKYAGTNIKRFYNIDWQTYQDGALPAKTKELLGLVASLVLRCDDCILYHLIRCREEEVSDSELEETVAIGLIVGGSITIPHIRRLWQAWDEMKKAGTGKARKTKNGKK